MEKLEKFKEFIKDKEFLIDKVLNKETTWQSLYEIYDLYGEDASIFRNGDSQKIQEEKEEVKDNKVNNLLKAFEGVDVNKINENLEGVRKILSVLGEFSKKEDIKPKRTYQRPNNGFDD